MGDPVLKTWTCRRLDCQAENVARLEECGTCGTSRTGIDAPKGRTYPRIDLEEFFRKHFAQDGKQHRAKVHIINNEVFVELTPNVTATRVGGDGDPAIYRVDDNLLTPCDNFGRPGW